MTKDFVIKDSILCVKPPHILDMHNNYDLVEIVEKSSDNNFILNFEKTKGSWSIADDPGNIQLQFSENINLSSSCKLFELLFNDIDAIGYKSENDQNLDWLKEEKYFDKNDTLVIIFSSGEWLKIRADFANLIIKN